MFIYFMAWKVGNFYLLAYLAEAENDIYQTKSSI